MFAANHNRLHFSTALLANDSFHLTMSIFARDDDNLVNGIGALKCLDRVCDDRFAINRRKKFIQPHAATTAGGDDDGRKHFAIKATIASALPCSAFSRQRGRQLSPAPLS